MSDQLIIENMNRILATSECPRVRHIAHRSAYYAHRRLMERRIYNNHTSKGLLNASLLVGEQK